MRAEPEKDGEQRVERQPFKYCREVKSRPTDHVLWSKMAIDSRSFDRHQPFAAGRLFERSKALN